MTHETSDAYLDHMSFADLQAMHQAIARLYRAGLYLQAGGFDAVYFAQPGERVSLTLFHEMQDSAPLPRVRPAAAPEVRDFGLADHHLIQNLIPDRPIAPDTDGTPPGLIATPIPGGEPEVAPDPEPEAASEPAPEPAPVFMAEPGPQKTSPAALSPATIPPGIKAQPQPWTEAEDLEAVHLYCEGLQSGQTQRVSAQAVATALDRPLDGTIFRLRNKLAARIAERMKLTLGAPTPPYVAPITPLDAPPLSSQGEDDGAQEPPAAVSPPHAGGDPLQAHLLGLKRNQTWTVQADCELIELACAGWEMAAIAQALGIDGSAVKARYDLLTGNHRDDKTEKWVRRFSRDAVLQALQARAKAEA